MYSCYIDESGHNGRKFNPEQPVEVLCGVLTDMTKLFKTQKEFLSIVNKITGLDIQINELKASNVYRGRKQWGKVEAAKRFELIEDILLWTEERKCKYLVCPIDTQKFFDLKASGNQFAELFKCPYEAGAINVLLALQRHQDSKKNNKGKTLVVFDEQKAHDDNLVKILASDRAFTDSFTGFVPKTKSKVEPKRLDQIIDIPYFSPSHLSILIQLADWAAFIINRYLLLSVYHVQESYEGEFVIIEKWYKLIGKSAISPGCIDAGGKNDLPLFYKSIRPDEWNAKKWLIEKPAVNRFPQIEVAQIGSIEETIEVVIIETNDIEH
ncbi:MAG: DUF3800 domain-containing protein [Flammeovirgaceae bacterium]|nr:DUF3800 domain-containing protein [Flammeovirgaceae bacterium]